MRAYVGRDLAGRDRDDDTELRRGDRHGRDDRRADGAQQVTIDGRPLYYLAKDAKAGDTPGRGVNKIWWVVSPTDGKIGG